MLSFKGLKCIRIPIQSILDQKDILQYGKVKLWPSRLRQFIDVFQYLYGSELAQQSLGIPSYHTVTSASVLQNAFKEESQTGHRCLRQERCLRSDISRCWRKTIGYRIGMYTKVITVSPSILYILYVYMVNSTLFVTKLSLLCTVHIFFMTGMKSLQLLSLKIVTSEGWEIFVTVAKFHKSLKLQLGRYVFHLLTNKTINLNSIIKVVCIGPRF